MSQSAGLYSGWRRERFGPFAGISGRQAGALALCWLPALAAVGRSHWASALQLGAVSVLVTILVVVPIRRRPAAKWLWDALLFSAGRALGWAEFRARAATGAGSQAHLDEPDLPGVAAVLKFHDGPPLADTPSVCVVQDPLAPSASAAAAGLRYVNDARMPGIRRLGHARVRYLDPDGRAVTNRDVLARINVLGEGDDSER